MQPTMNRIGRIYTTLSLAVLPVALVAMFTYLYSFDAQGPQVRGLPALATVIGVVLGVLGINTLVATLLAVFVKEVRPNLKTYLYTLLATAVVGGLLYQGFGQS